MRQLKATSPEKFTNFQKAAAEAGVGREVKYGGEMLKKSDTSLTFFFRQVDRMCPHAHTP